MYVCMCKCVCVPDQAQGFRFQVLGFRVQGSGFRVQGSGCNMYVCLTKLKGLGFRR